MPKTTLPPARAHGTTHGSRCEDMPKTTPPPARAHGTTHGSRCEDMPTMTLPHARAHGTTHGSRCEDMPKTTLPPARAHGTTHGSRCGKRLSPHLRIPVITRTSHAMLGMPSTPPACKCSPRRKRDAGHALEKLYSASTLKLLLQWSCSPLPVKLLLLQWSCSPSQ
jgi:hypothetical protein